MNNFYLYLIGSEDGKPLKIGVSNDPKSRLLQLQGAHPFHLKLIKKWATIYAFELERLSHYELRNFRMKGEWFSCPHKEAIDVVEGVIKNTSCGKDISFYAKKKDVVKSIAAQKAGQASGKKAKEISKRGIDRIKDRWPLPSAEWRTADLLEEADLSLNTVKSILGARPIAQYNYQAAQKRKERRNAKR